MITIKGGRVSTDFKNSVDFLEWYVDSCHFLDVNPLKTTVNANGLECLLYDVLRACWLDARAGGASNSLLGLASALLADKEEDIDDLTYIKILKTL